MHTYLVETLECPDCHGELEWQISEGDGEQIEAAVVRCSACAATYSVRDGIGLFLTPDLPRDDLWEEVESELGQYLAAHPEIERQLMEVPVERLSPADQFFRALVLEERGDYVEARLVEDEANRGLYTPEYTRCQGRQFDYVVEWLSTGEGPIVDLASGRCYLVEELVRRLDRPVVATDFSPRVLRRNRRWLQSVGLDDRVDLLAFDARRTPFRDGAVESLTTNQGLSNIEEPGTLLRELRRIVSGAFLAVSHFFPEDDEANAEVIREAGLAPLLYQRSALTHYTEAGWQVTVQNACVGKASPTPPGVVLEGARLDRLPAAKTELTWCVLLGQGQATDPGRGRG